MRVLAISLILLGSLGCAAPTVALFERDDYVMTKAGQTVADYTTRADGIWLSRPAVERLQRAKVLP